MKQTTPPVKGTIYIAPSIQSVLMEIEKSVLTGSQEGNNSAPDMPEELW